MNPELPGCKQKPTLFCFSCLLRWFGNCGPEAPQCLLSVPASLRSCPFLLYPCLASGQGKALSLAAVSLGPHLTLPVPSCDVLSKPLILCPCTGREEMLLPRWVAVEIPCDRVPFHGGKGSGSSMVEAASVSPQKQLTPPVIHASKPALCQSAESIGLTSFMALS